MQQRGIEDVGCQFRDNPSYLGNRTVGWVEQSDTQLTTTKNRLKYNYFSFPQNVTRPPFPKKNTVASMQQRGIEDVGC